MTAQPSLLDLAPPERPLRARFDGAEVARNAANEAALTEQLDRLHAIIADGRWRTVRDLAGMTRLSEPVVSAQLRNMRKPRFGALNVLGERQADGVYRYRLAPGTWTPRPKRVPAADRAEHLHEALGRVLGLFGPCDCRECPVCRGHRALRGEG